jgi:hypothetical protein
MSRGGKTIVALALVWTLADAGVSTAGFILVGSRSTLAGADTLNWQALGAEFSFPANGSTLSSVGGGTSATVRLAGNSSFYRQDQGSNWLGNFGNGDKLLFTNGDSLSAGNGPMTITFSRDVTAAGAQFQTYRTGAFTGTIDALDSTNVVLASLNFSGTSTNTPGTADFFGISATNGSTFRKLRFNGLTATENPQNFGINQLDFTATAAVNPAPAPPALLLAVLGLGSFGGLGWARRRFGRTTTPAAV